MIWSYYEDDRPDIQALVRATGQRVLDVGCAGGALGAALKARGAAFVAGVEACPRPAEQARARLDAVVEGDLLGTPLPFAEASFDWIVFADVLEHVPDSEGAIGRYLRYLSPTGRILVSVPNIRFYLVLLRLLFDRWTYADAGVRDRTHVRIFTRRSLERFLASEGLEIETLARNFRLFDDQSRIGRVGALLTRVVTVAFAPWFLPDLFTYQYLVVARRQRQP
jgi:2-polyprenyl-3-methyl-5-hydroxy-6-metoxy-1,4-benzoquinol methylase